MTEAVFRRVSAGLEGWAIRDVVVPFLATRALFLIAGILAQSLLPLGELPYPWQASTNPVINAFARWDAYWYDSIARFGYFWDPGYQSSVAFFPLYPVLMRGGASIIGSVDSQTLAVVGIVISNLALLAALLLLVQLVRLDFDEETGARAATYLVVFPTSFFLSAVYSDSLFLLLAIATFYAARTGRWWIAGALGAVAALTRPHGVLLLLPLAYEFVVRYRATHTGGATGDGGRLASARVGLSRLARPGRELLRRDALALGLVPIGLFSYIGYLGWRFGEPFATSQAQIEWGRSLVLPWQAIGNWLNGAPVLHGPNHSLLDLAFTLGIGALIVASWRVRPSYALFGGTVLLAVMSTGSISSFMRFGVTLFPIFIVLAVYGRTHPRFDRLFTAGSLALGCVLMAMFAQWHWVA